MGILYNVCTCILGGIAGLIIGIVIVVSIFIGLMWHAWRPYRRRVISTISPPSGSRLITAQAFERPPDLEPSAPSRASSRPIDLPGTVPQLFSDDPPSYDETVPIVAQ